MPVHCRTKIDFSEAANYERLKSAQARIDHLENELTEASSPDGYANYRTAATKRIAAGEQNVQILNSFEFSLNTFERRNALVALQNAASKEVADDIRAVLAAFADHVLDIAERMAAAERNQHIALHIEHEPSDALRVVEQIAAAVRSRSKDDTFPIARAGPARNFGPAMNTTQTNTLAAAAQEAGRRALAAIRSGEPPTYFANRMTLFKEMEMQQTVDAAKFLYGVFSGFETNVGHLIAGLHKEWPKVRELEAILDNQFPAILETNSKKVAVFQIGELGVLSPISFWTDEISKADDLKIGINSPGGCAGVARQLVEAITAKATSTCTVTNRAYSAAALLVQCFTCRRIAASGKLMLHGPRMFSYGSPEQVTADAVRVRSEVDFWIGLVETRTGLPRPTIANWLSPEKDYYFTAKEALDLGLVDEIIPDAPTPDPGLVDGTRPPIPHPDNSIEALALTVLGRLKSTFHDKSRFRAIVEEFDGR